MKRGFTLIELLVVVLIIGILSAIALPQYSQAVEKSRAAEAMSNIGSFSRAVDIWKLGNSKNINRTFTGSGYGAGQLDIGIPDDWVEATNTMTNASTLLTKSCSKNFCYDVNVRYVKAYRANSSTYRYSIWYDSSGHSYECIAFTEADLKLCKALSNMSVNDDSL